MNSGEQSGKIRLPGVLKTMVLEASYILFSTLLRFLLLVVLRTKILARGLKGS
jgi:hypothetical protein